MQLPPCPLLPLPCPPRAAFTLVELSIVLVIIGLLLGGVLVGQSLIRSSELQGVLSETSGMIAGTNTFQAKYGALPGDMVNATVFWGVDNANCSGSAGTVTSPGTCNGNGDGKISAGFSGGSATFPEMFRYWQQLSMAGFIKGKFTGVAGPGSAADFVGNVNAPTSRWRNAVYGIFYANTTDAPANASSILYPGNYGSFFIVGKGGTTGHPWGSLFSPQDAILLDSKVDDAKPGKGKIVSNNTNNFENNGACATSTAVDSAAYLNSPNVTCVLLFRQNF